MSNCSPVPQKYSLDPLFSEKFYPCFLTEVGLVLVSFPMDLLQVLKTLMSEIAWPIIKYILASLASPPDSSPSSGRLSVVLVKSVI